MAAVEYRVAREEDLEGLLSLYRQLNPEDSSLDLGSALAIWRESASKGMTEYFAAAQDGVLVSACCVTVVPNLTRGGRPYAIIENVITDEGRRGEGIGRRVVMMAVEYAKARGCYKVALMSGAKRAQAHAFYKAIGFDGDSKRGFEIRFR
jgi:GNAT superfamily N-acetyltransferase